MSAAAKIEKTIQWRFGTEPLCTNPETNTDRYPGPKSILGSFKNKNLRTASKYAASRPQFRAPGGSSVGRTVEQHSLTEPRHADHNDDHGHSRYANVNSCSSTLLRGSFPLVDAAPPLAFVVISCRWRHFPHPPKHLPVAPRRPTNHCLMEGGRYGTHNVLWWPFLRPVSRNSSLPSDDEVAPQHPRW